jgi:hypothetical protein
LTMQSGCGAIIDTMAWCLAEEGDACIVPGPLYPAFANDFQARARVHLHVADTEHPDYEITEEVLQRAYDECVAQKKPPKLLLLCNPCNPTGAIYSEETLLLCLRWARERHMHIISDEIYGNSVFPGETFISIAKVCRRLAPDVDNYLGDHVHIACGFSKDFAMSGLRVGTPCMYSQHIQPAECSRPHCRCARLRAHEPRHSALNAARRRDSKDQLQQQCVAAIQTDPIPPCARFIDPDFARIRCGSDRSDRTQCRCPNIGCRCHHPMFDLMPCRHSAALLTPSPVVDAVPPLSHTLLRPSPPTPALARSIRPPKARVRGRRGYLLPQQRGAPHRSPHQPHCGEGAAAADAGRR